MKGAIIEKGFKHYTFLDEIFVAFENEQLRYNWLITDLECNYYPDDWLDSDPDDRFYPAKKYIWLSGKELTGIVTQNKIQFIWGVLSAFEPSVALDQVLQYKLPFADGNKGFWRNPVSVQNPLAEIELVPWDSTLVLLIAKNDALVDKFMAFFPQSEDLAAVNAKLT